MNFKELFLDFCLFYSAQERISNPAEGDDLASVIAVIQKTGCFAINSNSFDFDLCLLDRNTVLKIQRCLDIKV